ncbi:hypothetical protein Y032_0765g2158 [Ancylostoma ceylanicum]|uniref:Uncharacterized protein n=1 Tax=Ancylostoma ceylanicum TaxID=53326 RepID=A0A016WDW4_9BILA|nr:hypothetical protein Y032_0765g2158 [Ancylostoma ceylanicum]
MYATPLSTIFPFRPQEGSRLPGHQSAGTSSRQLYLQQIPENFLSFDTPKIHLALKSTTPFTYRENCT